MTRDPAARLFSEYRYFGRRRRSAADYDAVVREGLATWAACRRRRALAECLYAPALLGAMPRLPVGMYAPFVQRWLRHFPAAQLLVLDGARLQRDPRGALARVFAFLGLPDPGPAVWAALLAAPPANVNRPGSAALVPWANTTALLAAFYAPFTAALDALVERHGLDHARPP